MNINNVENQDDNKQIQNNFTYLMKYAKYNNNNQNTINFQESNIILLGDSGVGKFSIIKKYLEDNKGTIIEKKKNFKIEIEIFNSKYNLYIYDNIEQLKQINNKVDYKAFLVYDITNKNSFNNLKNIWYPEMKDNGIILAVVGNKKDLNTLLEKEGREFSEEINCPFILTTKEEKDSIKSLFESIIYEINVPLYFKNNYLFSNTTNLKIYADSKEIIKKDIAFTPIFNEMVDLIHFTISTNTSLIFEGVPGQGKQKAINYICDLLGYEVEDIIITTNFTVKDLFKKTVIKCNDEKVELEEIKTKLKEKLYPKDTPLNVLSSKKKKKKKKNKKNKKKKKYYLFFIIFKKVNQMFFQKYQKFSIKKIILMIMLL